MIFNIKKKPAKSITGSVSEGGLFIVQLLLLLWNKTFSIFINLCNTDIYVTGISPAA